VTVIDIETALRYEWWSNHGCGISALYGDDGEMQCGACLLDFKRDDITKLRVHVTRKRLERGARAWEAMYPDKHVASPSLGTRPLRADAGERMVEFLRAAQVGMESRPDSTLNATEMIARHAQSNIISLIEKAIYD
jgi:hypothetical protein